MASLEEELTLRFSVSSLRIVKRDMLKLILTRILFSLMMILLGINGQLFAETQEISTYVHLIGVESQKNRVHSAHHHDNNQLHQLSHSHSKPLGHAHKHQHSKEEPEHEHYHSDGAIFGTPSLSHASLPSGYSVCTSFSSKEYIFPALHQALSDGVPSSNFRPPIL